MVAQRGSDPYLTPSDGAGESDVPPAQEKRFSW